VLGDFLGQDFRTTFGNCTTRTKEGKTVGALSGIITCKGRKTIEAIRNFGSIDMG
jgi:hypothetical protein